MEEASQHGTRHEAKHPLMPKHLTVKATNVLDRKPKMAVWKTRKTSRGIKHFAVETTAETSQLKSRSYAGKIDNNEAALHETTSSSMDVDETFCMEQPASPTKKKRVSLPTCLSLAESDASQITEHLYGRFHP